MIFIKKVQSAIGAKVDGIVGSETMAKVPILSRRVNPKHKVVKILQEELITRGYSMPKWGADGAFGAETETAIKKYQLNNKLVPDGIVGKNTWKKLLV